MSCAKFFRLVAAVFVIALVVYYITMPRGKDIPLI